ncbi:hypothetical protein PanWU01x14_253370 [Parasponia andersonii]|uniref:Uncharacterized protein n=1 Tax=Parasponia andersonii TaxID=3476 RepID=A0A2P5BBP6_PARAD|nr:hypothetical protein PanWU01x14_253370 [Parasponia andersonii]
MYTIKVQHDFEYISRLAIIVYMENKAATEYETPKNFLNQISSSLNCEVLFLSLGAPIDSK